MLSDEIKKVPIDEKKLNEDNVYIGTCGSGLLIYNLKTGEFNSQDMVKAIRKIIETNA